MLDGCSEAGRVILAASIAVAAIVLVFAARTLRILLVATRRIRERAEAEARSTLARHEEELAALRDRERAASARRSPPPADR